MLWYIVGNRAPLEANYPQTETHSERKLAGNKKRGLWGGGTLVDNTFSVELRLLFPFANTHPVVVYLVFS
jgi:hypothetical protein